MSDSEDRPRKSWREIDNMRNHSYHRRDDTAGSGRRPSKKEIFEERRYKSELEKIFSGGSLPPHLAEKLGAGQASDESVRKHELVQKIRQEERPNVLMKYISELYALENGLPRLEDVLVPAIEHDDVEISLAAINGLIDLQETTPLKRKSLIKIKLKSVLGLADDSDIIDSANQLLKLVD